MAGAKKYYFCEIFKKLSMRLNLGTSVGGLGVIARKLEKRLKKLGIETVEDLIFYFPVRHDDLSVVSDIAALKPEQIATIRGRIELINSRRSSIQKKFLTEAIVGDASGKIKIIWFNQPYLGKMMKIGEEYYFFGKIGFGDAGREMVSPDYEKVRQEQIHLAGIIPAYPLTAGVSQKQLRYLIKIALAVLPQIVDFLPESIKKDFNFIDLARALQEIHFPESNPKLDRAVNRLKFDELFMLQLFNRKLRYDLDKKRAPEIPFREAETKSFVAALPFELTSGQRKAAWKIIKDLGRTHPMNRLLNGDVGSGKTVVAALAALNVLLSDYQVAFMAPTEILAAQHFETIKKFFSALPISIGLLTGSSNKIIFHDKEEVCSRPEFFKKLSHGEIKIVLGTHALIEEKAKFAHLALVIVDEQHRFGVEQRKSLRERVGDKEAVPHLLSMTATPIPRTLSLALYGDLDISYLTEIPKNRQLIITKIVAPEKRALAYEFIAKQISGGRQVFVICSLIDPSDKLGVKSVKEEYEKLKKIFFRFRVEVLHGQLKTKEKERVMNLMKRGAVDILVSTSVVEVGVDIPNATVMVIEGAERFELAQLHQFRGRVGRGAHQSYCLLFSESRSERTKERLAALLTAKNGFELAELDLKIRGPGEVYGTRQSGFPEFKIATLFDYALMRLASEAAEKVLAEDGSFGSFPLLKQKFDAHRASIHFE